MTITEFLLARIAEDEASANTAGAAHWASLNRSWDSELQRDIADVSGGTGRLFAVPEGADEHVARWSPARVLTECEAKRRIVEEHPIYRGPRLLAVDGSGIDYGCETCHATSRIDSASVIEASGPCFTLCALASVYADHPDFDPA